MFESRVVRSCIFAIVLAVAGRPAPAVEVVLNLPGAPDHFVEYLQDATLTYGLAGRENVTTQDLLAAVRADYARLVGALYESGFYGGSVSILIDGREAADISPIAGPGRIDRVVFRVDPGPAFTFSTARVAPLAPGTELPEGFATGRGAYSPLIADAARAGIDGWRGIGHAKASVADQTVTADHRTNRLAADIALAPGPRLTFGELLIERPGKVRPERVREIAGLPTGETFSPEDLEQAARRLRRTGAFRSVVLEESETVGPGNTLPINALLTDAKPRRIGFGAELSSLEGLTLSGFWMHRNLLGGAERFRIDGEISGIGGDSGGTDYRVSARFDRPATFTPDTGFFLEARAQELDEPDFRERSVRVGAGLTHIFSEELTGEAGIAYQFTDINDDLGSRTLEHLLFPASLTFDNRDEPLDARSGYYASLEVTPFLGLDQSSAGARVYGDARAYLGVGEEDSFVFAFRAQAGSVAGAGLTEVPPAMLFFSGGAGTVRGQPYQSLAVNLGGGTRLGGRSFLAFSGEVRAPVGGKFSAVAFADTGFVGQDSWGTENGDWHSGAGFGVRYETGIGPIRVDIATPLDDDAGENFELYIGIGQAF